MSSDTDNIFTKGNLDTCLKELAKEYRRLNGKAMPAEIILVGGAAILANYGFRDSTADIDAVINSASSMKDAINHVGDRFGLSNGWLNADFIRTGSYSPKLSEISIHYKTFSNILEIRTISAEYLIAMKLRSGRKYKNDLSDIIGILAEQKERNLTLSFEQIDTAVKKLYDSWTNIPAHSRRFIEEIMQKGNYVKAYASVREEEKKANNLLIQFEENYPNTAKESNVNDILTTLKARQTAVPNTVSKKPSHKRK